MEEAIAGTDMPEYNQWKTTSEIAVQLGVVAQTVKRWCERVKAGKPSMLRADECLWMGSGWRIRQSAVLRILAQ